MIVSQAKPVGEKRTVTGVVKDIHNEPIIGATVSIKGTGNGTVMILMETSLLQMCVREIFYSHLLCRISDPKFAWNGKIGHCFV